MCVWGGGVYCLIFFVPSLCPPKKREQEASSRKCGGDGQKEEGEEERKWIFITQSTMTVISGGSWFAFLSVLLVGNGPCLLLASVCNACSYSTVDKSRLVLD